MAIRNVTHVLKHSNILNRPLPNTSILGEPIVNTANGIVFFSGNSTSTQGWTPAGTGPMANFFEVGSNLYDLQLRHRITKYDNQSGTNLIGKFLSGTTNGFVLANISAIQGIDTYVTGGTFSNGTTIFTNNLGGTFSVTGYASIDTYVTGGTLSSGTTTFRNNTGGTFDVTGYFTGYTYTPEDDANKQDSMVYDGTGIKYPTVDAVNIQANSIARATVQTGFIDTSDGFSLYKYDDNTLGISGSTIGIAFSQLFKVPPFTPSNAIVQLTSRLVPLSDIGLTGSGSSVKFVGFRESDDSIVFSDINFIQSPTICQLGVVLVKFSAGTTSFIDVNRTFINQPDIAAYSNLETTGFGVKSSVIVNHNGTDLKIKNTGGVLLGISVNWNGNNNDLLPIPVSNPTGATFTYLYSGASLSTTPIPFVSDIDPTRYWNGSALVNLPTTASSTVQRFLVTIRGNVATQYSEFVYPSFQDALNNASVQTFSDVLPIGTFAEVGRLIVISGCTDLSNTTQAVFLITGGGGGGGGSTVSPTVVAWGSITGSITDQTDLQTALDDKMPLVISPINNIPKIVSTGLTSSNISDNGSLVTISANTSILASITGNSFIKSGGTSTQFLKADGSVDNTAYQPFLGYSAENVANKVDVISGSSSTEYPTENAVVSFFNSNSSPIVKNEFIYTSGPQTFVTSQNFGQVFSVSVQGGGPLKADQYVLNGSSAVTITDILDSGDYIIILFTAISASTLPYYTQAQTDTLLNLKMDKQRQTKIVSTTTYTLLSSDSDKILYFTSSSAITMTIPSGLTLGNSYEVFQQGTGQISFTGVGTTIRYSLLELPMTAERYSLVGIDSIANVTEEYHLYGQLYPI